jgi:hypothetical protein
MSGKRARFVEEIGFFWQETPFLIGRKLLQPTLYVAGEDDAVVEFAWPAVDNLEKNVPNLWKKGPAPRRGALDRAGSAGRSKPVNGQVPALDR